MTNQLLLKEIHIKENLIQVLNETIVEMQKQIEMYRKMIIDLQDVVNEANNILAQNFIDV